MELKELNAFQKKQPQGNRKSNQSKTEHQKTGDKVRPKSDN